MPSCNGAAVLSAIHWHVSTWKKEESAAAAQNMTGFEAIGFKAKMNQEIFGFWRLMIWEYGAKNKKFNQYQVTYILWIFSHVFQALGNFEISDPLKKYHGLFLNKNEFIILLAIISLKLG